VSRRGPAGYATTLRATGLTSRARCVVLFGAASLATLLGMNALVSYGINLNSCFHRAAYYVDEILKGAKPGDLPIEFPTKIEFVINLKTAKILGLKIPPTLLVRADEVIE
jgi:putative ABC transport system substrate-binding protein